AEEPVVLALGPVEPDLEPSGHVSLHRLPVPAAGEAFGRSRGDGDEYGQELRANAAGAGVEKLTPRAGHVGVIGLVSLEVDDVVRVIGRGPGTCLRAALGGLRPLLGSLGTRHYAPARRAIGGCCASAVGVTWVWLHHRNVLPGSRRSPTPIGDQRRQLPDLGAWPK